MQVVADQAGTSNAALSKGLHRAQQRDSRDQQKPPKPKFEAGTAKTIKPHTHQTQTKANDNSNTDKTGNTYAKKLCEHILNIIM